MSVETEGEAADGGQSPPTAGRPPSPPRRQIDTTGVLLDLATCPVPMRWEDLFGDDHPVELEVGSGKGLFLANAASANPGRNFLGLEIARKYAGRAAERLVKRSLRNARIVAGDARQFLARYVPPDSLHAVHVYFPDPWWKSRHKKRRVFAEPLVLDVGRGLIAGGDFRVATDVAEYFGRITALMASHREFEELDLAEPKAPEHDEDYLTNFERKYRMEGRPIFRKHYRKRRPGPVEVDR